MGVTLIDPPRVRRSLERQFLLSCFGYPSVARDVAKPRRTRPINLFERLGEETKNCAVRGARGRCFRITMHGATLAPGWRHVYRCCCFVLSNGTVAVGASKQDMTWRAKTYPVAISRALEIGGLALLSESEAEEGEDSGFLDGNQMYQDLRALSRADLATTIKREASLMTRLKTAPDLDPTAELVDEERLDVFEPADGLWGLDIGVASAVVAFSVLGGTPVSSCNAGGFGGTHTADNPYVTGYLPPSAADELLKAAQSADVGVATTDDGLVQIFGRTDLDLLRFARAVNDLGAQPDGRA
jgi:hypothetical protein